MKLSDLDGKAKRQEAAVARWYSLITRMIASEISDAVAHAQKAVTGRLMDTADGRPSARRVSASPSMKAAIVHVRAIREKLTGPTVRSLDGMLRDAREDFYWSARDEWREILPSQMIGDSAPGPAKSRTDWVRGFPLHGMDLAKEFRAAEVRIVDSLKATVELLGRSVEVMDGGRGDRLTTWRTQAENRLQTMVKIALSDSQVFADRVAQSDLVRPELREEPSWES